MSQVPDHAIKQWGVFGGYGGGPCGYDDLKCFGTHKTKALAEFQKSGLNARRSLGDSYYIAECLVCKCCGTMIKELGGRIY